MNTKAVKLTWKEGLPRWLSEEVETNVNKTSLRSRAEYAKLLTSGEEVLHIIHTWLVEPADLYQQENWFNNRWAIFLSHEELASGEGQKEEAEQGLNKLLQSREITLES
jgi:hypothetical protein